MTSDFDDIRSDEAGLPTGLVTLMFTDIVDSVGMKRCLPGDEQERNASYLHEVQEPHHALIRSAVAEHGGREVKTIGDSFLVAFVSPSRALRCAIDIQKRLDAGLLSSPFADEHGCLRPLQVRIGLHTGLPEPRQADYLGQSVDKASRITALASGGQVFLSEQTMTLVRGEEAGVRLVYRGERDLKGLGSSPVYEAVWREVAWPLPEEGGLPAAEAAPGRSPEADVEPPVRTECYVLDVSLRGGELLVAAYRRTWGEEPSVRRHERVPWRQVEIDRLSGRVVDALNMGGRTGAVSAAVLAELKGAGQLLFDLLLGPAARQLLREAPPAHLLLRLSDNLVQIPWELLHTGRSFMGLLFAMGRVVETGQDVVRPSRSPEYPLRVLVIADPRSNLPGAREEGQRIVSILAGHRDSIHADLAAGPLQPGTVLDLLGDYDVVHYAGHAEYNNVEPAQGGWLVDGGVLTAREVRARAADGRMPLLVFSNACRSGHTGSWQLEPAFGERVFGLANAFLAGGVRHYLGTFWDVQDVASRRFAGAFYESVVSGATVGGAVLAARRQVLREHGETDIHWGTYVLYGDPTNRVLPEVPVAGAAVLAAAGVTRGAQAAGQPRRRIPMSRRNLVVAAVIGLLLMTALGVGGYMLGRSRSGVDTALEGGEDGGTIEQGGGNGEAGSAGGKAGKKSAGKKAAEEFGPATVRGTVIDIGWKKYVVRSLDTGKVYTFAIGRVTDYNRRQKLRGGERITVYYRAERGRLVATRIDIQ